MQVQYNSIVDNTIIKTKIHAINKENVYSSLSMTNINGMMLMQYVIFNC